MSKKILVLTGSARKGGNSNRMAQAFAEAAAAQGPAHAQQAPPYYQPPQAPPQQAPLETEDDLPPETTAPASATAAAPAATAAPAAAQSLADTERDQINAALRACRGNKTKAAELLGISRRTLHRKLKEWGEG